MSEEQIAVPVSMDGWVRFGITKREYFAGQVLPAILRDRDMWAEARRVGLVEEQGPRFAAELSLLYVDALMAALESSDETD